MNASEAFVEFVTRVLVPVKAKRFAVLASSKKGQRKILDGLSHEFDLAVRESVIQPKDYSKLWDKPCYVFHAHISFGASFPSVQDAYDKLSLDDSWLILLQDASAGIHRPEWRWDDEKMLVAR